MLLIGFYSCLLVGRVFIGVTHGWSRVEVLETAVVAMLLLALFLRAWDRSPRD